uniref:Uncharacterized protein n=1 Tax=Arundo donax TaxID=35708 RepID=A0A0A8ZU49_ARUDO
MTGLEAISLCLIYYLLLMHIFLLVSDPFENGSVHKPDACARQKSTYIASLLYFCNRTSTELL